MAAISFNSRARVHRITKNPLDKSTIVSVYPQEITVSNPTLYPGKFKIPAARENDFSILVVSSSSWFRETQDSNDVLEIMQSSIEVAGSIILDWSNGLMECNMVDRKPGLFHIPGEWNKISILKTEGFQEKLAKAREVQKNYFLALINLADGLWVAGGGNPKAVPKVSRIAAESLGITNKEWLRNYQATELIRCVACGSMRNAEFPVCPTCKAVVDKDKAKSMGLVFAT